MQYNPFGDERISWKVVEAIGARIHVLGTHARLGIADVLIRFEANRQGKLHRHVCDFTTFVLQGELRFWRPDGSLKEVRPTGHHVQIAAHGEPHCEGAGDRTAVVLFSFRGSTGDMIHYLDEDGAVAFRLGFPDFVAAQG
ncbi:hypothetical protein [Belnapia rosea]|uniref:Cupin domain-containing protein n=1 Tax=Belnapia rosea TaxID=938405 RepID=A0A1G7DYV5_9PROT|nr:hypothetical protein [Belnapia rosea]SDE56614.1 hypothetical protein SAMN04487779_10568 [Belnapia rosea]